MANTTRGRGDGRRSSDKRGNTFMIHEASRRLRDSFGKAKHRDSCWPQSFITKVCKVLGCVRSATAGGILLLCVGTLLLWILSYNSKVEFFNNVTKFKLYCLESWKGKLQFSHSTNSGKTWDLNKWTYWSIPESRLYADYAQHARDWGASSFAATWTDENRSLAMPHWAWVVSAALFAILLKPRPKWQYGFPDILLLTAMVAILLIGMSVET
jgi:hypothetical protein